MIPLFSILLDFVMHRLDYSISSALCSLSAKSEVRLGLWLSSRVEVMVEDLHGSLGHRMKWFCLDYVLLEDADKSVLLYVELVSNPKLLKIFASFSSLSPHLSATQLEHVSKNIVNCKCSTSIMTRSHSAHIVPRMTSYSYIFCTTYVSLRIFPA